MKRAWEIEHQLTQNAKPIILQKDEQTWENAFDADKIEENRIKELWLSKVPGSGAPEHLIIAAIQSTYNMGYDVSEAEKFISPGLLALEKNNKIEMAKYVSLILNCLNNAKPISGHPSFSFVQYNSFDEISKTISFLPKIQWNENQFQIIHSKIYSGWLAQIIGGALGTAIEGYTIDAIRETFGEIYDYVRPPNTYNDDITYEIAFLLAFESYGYNVRASEIALEWVSRIPQGWSAEGIALNNLRNGIFPPESGSTHNPFREWIGAQMRGSVCGLVSPGDPKTACKLAMEDASISHTGNGALGEVFNAILASLAFENFEREENKCRKILQMAINMIPKDSEYFSVLNFAMTACIEENDWEKAWRRCDIKFQEYNWIHAYPNAAAEVIALFFCGDSLTECLHIISMEGLDVDCNAAQIATILGVLLDVQGIDEKWSKPIGDELQTYMRGFEKSSIKDLADRTFMAFCHNNQ